MAARNEEMQGATAFPGWAGRVRRARGTVAAAGLAALVFFAFGDARRCGFVRFDDDVYVFENPRVAAGLTAEGTRWALATGHAANWHPLTWLSHMADVEWYGLRPAGHHLTSLLLHAANAILLFWVLRGMTGRFWPALLAAALWAAHPLRTESVVWISERKDVLAMLFGLLAVGMHGRNASGEGTRPTRFRMGPVAAFFALSLMAKPTWVTLPFLLLLLDFWPLKRWPTEPWRKLATEKWPLFLLAAASCAVTYAVQQAGGAVRAFEGYPFPVRLGNAAVAYMEYVRALVWPVDLSFFYPHPGAGIPGWRIWGAVALLAAATGAAWRARRRQPWWLAGWLWFLGALVPMIGLVQVGGAAWADRYSYLPHLGLVAALVFGAGEIPRINAPGDNKTQVILGTSVLVLVLVLTLMSRRQTQVWRDSETLFAHALAVREDNALAHGNLGAWLAAQGRAEEARRHLERSLEIQPRRNDARFNLGNLRLEQGDKAGAIQSYRAMVADNPRHAQALNNLAYLLATDPAATEEQAQEALAMAKRALACAEEPDAAMRDTLDKAERACGIHARP